MEEKRTAEGRSESEIRREREQQIVIARALQSVGMFDAAEIFVLTAIASDNENK